MEIIGKMETHEQSSGAPKHSFVTIELTKDLVDEHRLIKRMIDVLEKEAGLLEKGQKLEPLLFVQITDFIRNFADGFHHAKEEDILFREMVRKGMPEKSSPIEAMLIEHEQGRTFVRGIISALVRFSKGDSKAVRDVTDNAYGYINLLREHIEKEDDILYPLAERIFSHEEKKMQLEEYKKAEINKGGAAALKKYKMLVEELEKELNTAQSSAKQH